MWISHPALQNERKTFLDFQFINGLDDDEGSLKVIFLLTFEGAFSEYVMRLSFFELFQT